MPITWRGRRLHAFVPSLLADRDLTLNSKAVSRCGAAGLSVAHGAEALPEDYVPLARLLLRAEGIASSSIEGVQAPVVEVVLAEQDETGRHSPARWVPANLTAILQAVAHAGGTSALTVEELCRWHTALMAASPPPARHVGRCSPLPLSASGSPPPSGATAGLTQYRFSQTSAWVAWFADAVSGAGAEQRELITAVDQLRHRWTDQLAAHRGVRALHADASAWQVLPLLPRHLVLTARLVATELGVTRKAAGDALRTLVDAAVLTPYNSTSPVGPGRPAQLYVSTDLLGLAGSSPLRR